MSALPYLAAATAIFLCLGCFVEFLAKRFFGTTKTLDIPHKRL